MKHYYIKSMLTALLLLCCTIVSAQDFYDDGLLYDITDATAKTLMVFDGRDKSGDVVIPNKLTYGTTFKVTSIGDYAFQGCAEITSVTIGNSVTSIGEGAFYGCSSLKTVINLSSLTFSKGSTDYGYVSYYADKVINAPNGSVEGDFVFGIIDGVNTLCGYVGAGGDVTLPENYNGESYAIGNSVFAQAAITSVTIPNSVTSIGEGAFYGCTGLTSVTIPNSVKSIGGGAFYGCSGLTSITIPNSVKGIGYGAFCGCSSLTSVTIPNSVIIIEDEAFYGCTNLKTVTNKSSLNIVLGSIYYGYVAYYADKVITINADGSSNVVIGDYKFTSANGVNTLVEYLGDGGDVALPENYNGKSYVIGADVFKNNTAITSVTIPGSVTSIGSSAFDGCDGLTAVHISDLAAWCKIDFYNSPSNPLSYAHNLYLNGAKVTDLVIPYGVTEINSYAFQGCSGLTSVTIPNSVTRIGDNAFEGCSGLKTVINLSSFTFSKGSTDYGYVAYYADKVTNATNGSVEGDFVFGIIDGVNTLCGYIGDGGNITLPADYKGENYVISLSAFQGCTGLTSVTIPNSVTSIGYSAFGGCSGLTSVTIGNSVTSIDRYAFNGCSGLTSIEIPGSVTSIGYSAFGGCSGLTSIEIPGSVTSIDWWAFEGCSGLTSIEIPGSVTSIGYGAFYGCSSLTSVTSLATTAPALDTAVFSDISSDATLYYPAGSDYSSWAQYFANTEELEIADPIYFSNYNGLPGSMQGNNHVWESGKISFSSATNGIRITVFDTNSPDFHKGFPMVALGELEFYNANGEKIDYTAAHVATNSLESSEGSLEGLCDGDYSTFYHSTWRSGTNPSDYVYVDVRFAQPLDAVNIKIVGRSTGRLVPTHIGITSSGVYCPYPGIEGRCGDNARWSLENGVLTIRGTGAMWNSYYDYSLPWPLDEITHVIIEDGITSIGFHAFHDFSGLTSVEIPGSVTSIGSEAFYGCTNLKTVTNKSSLNIVKGSANHGYVAYYADEVITVNADGNTIVTQGTQGDYRFTTANGVNTLVAYLGSTLDSWISTNAGEDSSTSENTWTINAQAGDILTFYWRVSSESDYDKLIVTIDGSEILNESGERSAYYAYTFENAGTYTLVAQYTKDYTSHAGDDCASISNVKIANGALVLPENCNGKNYVIGADAFKNNTAITSVAIPAGVTSISDGAFYGCENLKTVTNNSSLNIVKGSTENGYVAYYADKVINYRDFVFEVEDGVNTLVEYLGTGGDIALPENYNGESYQIGDLLFYGCSGLTSVTIPGSVTSIGRYAFYDCRGLTSVTIPGSVTSIGPGAFDGCTGLTAVHISDLAAWCRIDFSDYNYSNPLSHAHNLYLNGAKVTDLVIPSGITEIKQYAFNGCSGLTSVTIGNSVTSIGKYAFYGCSGLTSVTIPGSVTNIGDWAFDNCSGLTAVHISDLAAWCKINFSVGASNPLYCAHNLYLNGEKVTDLVIPSGITDIKQHAFYECSGLTSVTIPNSVTSIGSYAFQGCEGITSVTIPNSVTSIGEWAFYGCRGLTSVTIGNSVTSIGSSAFAWCDNLKTVYNGSSLNIVKGSTENGCVAYYADKVINIYGRINDCVFRIEPDGNCTLIKYVGTGGTVTLPGTYEGKSYTIAADVFKNNTAITGVIISEGVTAIPESVFEGCSNLTSLVIPNSVTSIGSSAFRGCTGLTSITIPNSVTSIGTYAFYDCTGIESLYISNSIESIGDNAFKGCNNIFEIKIGSKKAVVANENIFSTDVYNNACLYVPMGRKFAYERTAPWNKFYILEMPAESLPGDVNGDAVVNVSDFAALANIILEISPKTDSADVNGDAVVNVSDFAALANIILNTSASNAAPKKAAATTRSSVESSLTIEPFSICPGEEVEVEVLMENPGVEISQIEFELTLPTGIEIVYDDENECDMVDVGSRTTYKNHTVGTNKRGDNTTKIICTSQMNKTFKNESGDVLIIVVRATDAFTAANAEFSITKIALGLPDGKTYLTPADYTGVISNTTGIDEIMNEQGTLAVYTLAGVKVMETTDANDVKSLPAGLYIVNGKKVVVE